MGIIAQIYKIFLLGQPYLLTFFRHPSENPNRGVRYGICTLRASNNLMLLYYVFSLVSTHWIGCRMVSQPYCQGEWLGPYHQPYRRPYRQCLGRLARLLDWMVSRRNNRNHHRSCNRRHCPAAYHLPLHAPQRCKVRAKSKKKRPRASFFIGSYGDYLVAFTYFPSWSK